MDNGIWNLVEEITPTEEVVATATEDIVSEEELNGEAIAEPLIEWDTDTTLKEDLYKETLKEEIEKTKEEKAEVVDDLDLPDPTPEEKAEAISDIVDNIQDEVDTKNVAQDTLEQVATMFYEKELEMQKSIKEKDIALEKLTKAYEELLSQYNDAIYDRTRVKVEDPELWYFLNLKNKIAKTPADKTLQKELAKYYMLELKTIYPEFEPTKVVNEITEKRLKAIEAVTAKSNSDAGIKIPETQKKAKPIGFAIPNV